MPYIYRTKRKDGTYHPRWRFQYRDWEGRKRKATGTTSRSQTQRIAAKIEAEQAAIRSGQLPPPPLKNMKFPDARADYLAWGNMQGGRGGRPWAPEHARKKEAQIAWWETQLGLKWVADLDGSLSRVEKTLQKMRQDGSAGRTLANYVATLRAFARWCVDRDILEGDPFKKLASIDQTPKEKRRAMTVDEVRRLLAAVSTERQLLLEVALCTGLRANELKQLRVMHVNSEDSCLLLEDWTKNRKEGFQPLPRRLLQRLLEHSEGKEPGEPLLQVSGHLARELDKDLARVGIKKRIEGKGKIDFHALRVAYCTFLREAGADMKEAQTLARHSDPRLTMKTYMRTRDEGLSAVTESVADIVLGTDGTGDDPDPTIQNPFTIADQDTSSKAAG